MGYADNTDYDDGTSMIVVSPKMGKCGDVFVHYNKDGQLVCVHIWSEKKQLWINHEKDDFVVQERDENGKLKW